MATVFPDNEPIRFRGIEPDLIARLCEEALRTRAVNSAGVKSAIERRWRGAKGEVGGMAGDEGEVEEYWRTTLVGIDL